MLGQDFISSGFSFLRGRSELVIVIRVLLLKVIINIVFTHRNIGMRITFTVFSYKRCKIFRLAIWSERNMVI